MSEEELHMSASLSVSISSSVYSWIYWMLPTGCRGIDHMCAIICQDTRVNYSVFQSSHRSTVSLSFTASPPSLICSGFPPYLLWNLKVVSLWAPAGWTLVPVSLLWRPSLHNHGPSQTKTVSLSSKCTWQVQLIKYLPILVTHILQECRASSRMAAHAYSQKHMWWPQLHRSPGNHSSTGI